MHVNVVTIIYDVKGSCYSRVIPRALNRPGVLEEQSEMKTVVAGWSWKTVY